MSKPNASSVKCKQNHTCSEFTSDNRSCSTCYLTVYEGNLLIGCPDCNWYICRDCALGNKPNFITGANVKGLNAASGATAAWAIGAQRATGAAVAQGAQSVAGGSAIQCSASGLAGATLAGPASIASAFTGFAGHHVARKAAAKSGKNEEQQAKAAQKGEIAGSIGGGAAVGAALGGPVGAAAGAAVGGVTYVAGKCGAKVVGEGVKGVKKLGGKLKKLGR